MTPDLHIRCHGVEKAFGAKRVLRGVDLDVRTGETLVILGGSGSGKSVLLKHMNALLRPDRGTVEVDGTPLAGRSEESLVPVRRQVGMLFQMGALFDSLTVGDNVAYGLREHRVCPEDELPDRIERALTMVDLPGAAALMPAELSGGMRKRAALARTLALEPRALLYDEPTTGLDPVVGSKINHLIRDLQTRLGLTSVVVTHDLHSAFFVGDRIAFLHEGRIRSVGTIAEIRATADTGPPGVPRGRVNMGASTRVGLVILAGLVIFGAALFTVGEQDHLWRRKVAYQVHFARSGGLQKGAQVSLSGVAIGTVTDMEFPSDPTQDFIDVHIEVESRIAPRIREHTVASIHTFGLLGDRYIELAPGPADAPPLRARQRDRLARSSRLRGPVRSERRHRHQRRRGGHTAAGPAGDRQSRRGPPRRDGAQQGVR